MWTGRLNKDAGSRRGVISVLETAYVGPNQKRYINIISVSVGYRELTSHFFCNGN